VLHQRTGNLIDSTQPHTIRTGDTQLEGNVAVDNTAFYGKIHEFGGDFYVSARRLSAKKALIRNVAGRATLGGYTRPYTIHFPARSFMLSSFGEMREQIITDLNGAVARGTSK
jgi:hypothetical protein